MSEITLSSLSKEELVIIKNPKNQQAIAGFVVGLLSFFFFLFGLVGIALSIMGLVYSIKGLGSEKKGFAIAGIILSVLGFILLILGTILLFTVSSGSFQQGWNSSI
jgi:hypothetical protein